MPIINISNAYYFLHNSQHIGRYNCKIDVLRFTLREIIIIQCFKNMCSLMNHTSKHCFEDVCLKIT